MIVYIYTFPNGKKYVGQTTLSLNQRAQRGRGYKNSPLVYNAIQKYGWDNIQKEIFECKSEFEMNALECSLIEKYQTTNYEFGYNITSGGRDTFHHSDETKEKIRKSKIGEKNPFYGKHHSEETKKILSKANKGHKISDEQIQQIKKANTGRKHTEEERQKMRQNSGQAKKVKCLETGIIYPSAAEAARKNNLNASSLRKVCNKVKNFNSCGGFHWQWA